MIEPVREEKNLTRIGVFGVGGAGCNAINHMIDARLAGVELHAVHEALEDELVDEVRRSLAFYRTLGRLPDPLQLQLSGGTARLPGIAGKLGDLLEFPVSVFDPFADLGGAARARVEGGPQFAQAYGLALRKS